jgi:hypothetical protein
MPLNELLLEMKPMLLVAGVPPKQINIRTKAPKIDTALKAFDWLHDLKMSKEWDDLCYAWGLLPEETWARYAAFELEGLREQLILEKSQKALLKSWKTNRPKIFGTASKKN